MSSKRSEAISVFDMQGPAAANDLSPRQVLIYSITHVNVLYECNWQLVSCTSWHSSDTVVVTGYQACKAFSMMATWSGHESGSLADLLRQYWADVIISHLSSYESLDGIVIKGNDSISNSS